MVHGALPAGKSSLSDDADRQPVDQVLNKMIHTRRNHKGMKLAPWQLKRAQELMFDQMTGVLEVAQIAQGLGMSTAYFTKAFKNTVGIPPYGWHLRQRITRSASLLHDQKLTLSEIAAECGFSDQSHYTKAFRRLTGITPGRWRKKLRAGPVCVEDLIKPN
ncbi:MULTISPECIES: helix-turn-helix domain-containing protein [Sphingomonadales]|nr:MULTISPECIES: AraC family transcriptional regulator [Sphingomonadaceae]EKU73406.1 hypothetical protein HMPREF9718_03875 [Sphingobium yanoikuyae ATCC 51230]WQE08191.1 AraC family transcriptional regulator [Sphingobium yanoikuyae]